MRKKVKYWCSMLLCGLLVCACSDGELEGDLYPKEPNGPGSGPDVEEYGNVIDGLVESMVRIPGGTFLMGNGDYDAEEYEVPTHLVTLSSFYISKYEVTQRLWQEVMGNNPSSVKYDGGYDYEGYDYEDDFPVTNVSYTDCQEFIRKLNQKTGKEFALPTEAQWEVAARGRYSKNYNSSDSYATDYFYYAGNSNRTLHNVNSFEANSFGLYCMSGNVWEWCADWYEFYSSNEQENPKGPSNGYTRVFRGGSCVSERNVCRVTYRGDQYSMTTSDDLGFRLALNGNLNLMVSPAKLEFLKNGGTKTLTLETSSENVRYKSSATWCNVTFDDKKFTVNVDENTGRKRNATIEITVDKESEIVAIEQDGVVFEILSEEVNIDTLNVDGEGVANKVFSLYQTSSKTWTVKSLNESWCHVEKNGTTFSLAVDKNPSKINGRNTRVIVSAGTTLSDTLWVFQKKSEELFQIQYDGVSYDTLTVVSGGCNQMLSLLKETSDYWFVESSNTNWCHVSRSGSGISFEVDSYDGEWTDRSGYIRAYTLNGLADTVQIVQKKKVNLTVNWKDVSTKALVFWCEKYGGYKDCNVETKASWTVISGNTSWCHITNKTGSGFRIVVDESSTERETYVEIDAEGVKYEIIVKQNMKMPEVGDLYNKDRVKGIILSLDSYKETGMIISLTENYLQWSTSMVNVGANDSQDGEKNMQKVVSYNIYSHPAFRYCYNLPGSGWYLPGTTELYYDVFAEINRYGFDKFNQILIANGGTAIKKNVYYWTSTQASHDVSSRADVRTYMESSYTSQLKSNNAYVRAIRKVTFE